jgi:hypothetical protein
MRQIYGENTDSRIDWPGYEIKNIMFGGERLSMDNSRREDWRKKMFIWSQWFTIIIGGVPYRRGEAIASRTQYLGKQ